MTTDTVFINALVPIEDDIALRVIGAKLRLNRSELVRVAIRRFIETSDVNITTLPRPEGAKPVPVMHVPAGDQPNLDNGEAERVKDEQP